MGQSIIAVPGDPSSLFHNPAGLADLKQRISTRLDQTLDFFYPLKDRGQKDYHGKRLSVRLKALDAAEGPYTNLKKLKTALER